MNHDSAFTASATEKFTDIFMTIPPEHLPKKHQKVLKAPNTSDTPYMTITGTTPEDFTESPLRTEAFLLNPFTKKSISPAKIVLYLLTEQTLLSEQWSQQFMTKTKIL